MYTQQELLRVTGISWEQLMEIQRHGVITPQWGRPKKREAFVYSESDRHTLEQLRKMRRERGVTYAALLKGETRYRLSDLAEITGMPERTIRYYIEKGILPGSGKGCGSRYTEKHLRAIRRFAELKAQNRTIGQIGEALRQEGIV